MDSIYKKIDNYFLPKAMVLMYHRIADIDYDPWQLSVTPSNFEQQLQFYIAHFDIISVAELIDQISKKQLRNNTICITFDDGYADNFLEAKPLLEKYNCPATFFIASNYIGSNKLFWWDQLEDIILGSPVLPQTILFNIRGEEYKFSVANTKLADSDINKQKHWQWPNEAPTERCELYLKIWEVLLPHDYIEIASVIQQLCTQTNYQTLAPEGKIPMNVNQLKLMSSVGLFDLGIHTNTHPALPFHSKEYQLQEMLACRNFLQPSYQQQLNTIAYPYGKFNEATLHAVKEAGIKAAFTTNEKMVTKKSDLLSLGRFQVNNWNVNQLRQQMKYWKKMI